VAVLHAPDLWGAVYANDRFAFGDADQARPDDPIGRFVVGGLEMTSDGKHALVTRLRAAASRFRACFRGVTAADDTSVAPECPAWDGRHPLPGWFRP